jgi:hypothetical protein
MTKKQLALIIAKMHSVSFTIAKEVAGSTLIFFHPVTVTEIFEAIVPHIHEIIMINISLTEIAANTWTG